MPERVDRLELVADEEELLSGPARDQVDETALERVRVLELVDHDRAEPKLLCFTHPLVVREQLTGEDLQILEVERRLPLLGHLILGGEQIEELLEQFAILCGRKLECGQLEVLPCLVEARGAVAARTERGEVDEGLRERRKVECGLRRGEVIRRRTRVGKKQLRRVTEGTEPIRKVRGLAQLEHELAPGRAERGVHARQHLPQANASIGREQGPPALVRVRAERLEGTGERLAAEHGAVLLVELVEAGVDPDLERVCAEQPGAEAVDRRDPCTVELAGELGPSARDESSANPRAQLGRGLAGIGDHEHRLDVEPLVADSAHESLDEHRGLPRARSRRDEDLTARLDRFELALVHAREILHIVQRSHHAGHSPPFGSWATSPERIRRAAPRAWPRAASTCPQKASSSR